MDVIFKCPKCKATIRKDELSVDMKRVYCPKCQRCYSHPFFKDLYDDGVIDGVRVQVDKVKAVLGIRP